MTEWRYEIQYGPEGEANYAWVYKGKDMIATMKTHHAIEVVKALSASPAGVRVETVVKAADDAIVSAVFMDFRNGVAVGDQLLDHKEVRFRVEKAIRAALKGDEQ